MSLFYQFKDNNKVIGYSTDRYPEHRNKLLLDYKQFILSQFCLKYNLQVNDVKCTIEKSKEEYNTQLIKWNFNKI